MIFYILETDTVNWTYTETYHAGTFDGETIAWAAICAPSAGTILFEEQELEEE